MISKVNLKARIERHSRVLKNSIKDIHPFRAFYHRLNYNIVFIVIVFFLPIYPMFANLFYNTSIDFYRTGIDESSIIDSYNINEEGDNLGDLTLNESSYISLNSIDTDFRRDVTGVSQIISYKVKPGDSISSIAKQFGIDKNSIIWANNLKLNDVIHPGDNLIIPPVSGIIHKVEKGETLDKIASYYEISKKDIIAQNSLTGENITIGQNLIIPGAVKKETKADIVITQNETVKKKNILSEKKSLKLVSKKTINVKSSLPVLTRSYGSNKFSKGYCTRFVAQYKKVTWRGNAKDWYENAASVGVPVGKSAQVGSIVVFNGAGYNSYYGHVGIVVGDDGSNIIVKDMNYRAFGEVTTRKVPKSSRSIKGYIYAD